MHPLKEWREKNNVSLHELGRRSGVGHTQIMRIERGENSPRSVTAKRLSEATGGAVTAGALLGITQQVVGVREDTAPFDHELRSEAKALGLNPDAIAKKAIEEEIQRKRFDAWMEDNRDAMDANAKDLRENGLWSDGLRQF